MMNNTILTITEDEFDEQFKPVQNHIDSNASWNGTLFETFGPELEYCFELAKKENRVWTIIECDDLESDADEINELDDNEEEIYELSCLYIISGFHYVNRQGFIITEKPYDQETEVKIIF